MAGINDSGKNYRIQQSVDVSGKAFLSAQKDLQTELRRAFPNRFMRMFGKNEIKLTDRFFKELRSCYDFAIKHGISKGASDFSAALEAILPKTMRPQETRQVLGEIRAVIAEWELEDRLHSPTVSPPAPEPLQRGSSIERAPVGERRNTEGRERLGGENLPSTSLGPHDRDFVILDPEGEFSVSMESMYEPDLFDEPGPRSGTPEGEEETTAPYGGETGIEFGSKPELSLRYDEEEIDVESLPQLPIGEDGDDLGVLPDLPDEAHPSWSEAPLGLPPPPDYDSVDLDNLPDLSGPTGNESDMLDQLPPPPPEDGQ